METVLLDGREYTKASVVAKRFNYTADYLGQLCRGKKVDARVIGRTWFVNIDSLEGHKSKKYATLRKPQIKVLEDGEQEVKIKTSGIAPKQYIKRVSMPLRSVHKSLQSSSLSEGAREVDVTYEADEASLLPAIKKSQKVTLLKVSPAGAEQLSVKSNNERSSILTPEPLPEVYLKGTLSVADATDKEGEETEKELSESRENDKNKGESEAVEHVTINQKTPRALKVTIKRLASNGVKLTESSPETIIKPSTQPKSNEDEKFTYSVTIHKPLDGKSELKISDLEHAPRTGSALPITVMVCSAVAMSVLLLSVVNIITVTTSGYDSTFVFQASLLLAFLHL